ncbi:DNA topoisomerase 3 [Candidatus Fukatsuia symbiotica]|uniref:DNA topoisomerase n=1 Tax=Candidatus Fukatsuia symbiotica TaxID=1878942 RepID=A0A2U8IB79_9GAMM|nr:type IA DNA topoisomerase [Candidatus Fukatsuia symbiotica]AWK15604.1 DNA topoisomerase III [Candidatus Fukatsuia symbiotica]MEA9446239.1 DNA topoisomerase 3 [Candidatus Fukatsuia symbiotica]
MKTLYIAEKPQLGQVIADALGHPRRKNGYIECGQNIVTWCVGHLLELAPPEAHHPRYAKWTATDLPLKLRPPQYVAKPATQDQLDTIGELIKQADEIVHAGDPDDEGQLLVDEVLWFFNNTCPVKRVLINDLNVNAARKALANLRDNQEFYGLSQKALARSIGDQLYGFNMTRAYTLASQNKGLKSVLSVGRVQTPILGLIVNRYLAFKNHAAASYFNVSAQMMLDAGTVLAKLVVPEDAPVDNKGRIIDEQWSLNVANACQGKVATVTQASVEDKQTPAPLPFSLLDLQVQMSRQHGIDAEKALAVTQSLREKHKAITYNRSDCNYLSSEQYAEASETLAALSSLLPELADAFGQSDTQRKSRAFDDSKVSAHTAIIPTAERVDVNSMTADERVVYLAIVKQYLAQFLPEKCYQAAQVMFDVEGRGFIARATKLTLAGWTTLISASQDNDGDNTEEVGGTFSILATLHVGDTGRCEAVNISKEKTKPLPLYSEATLLKDLQRVAKYVSDPRIKQLLLARDEGKAGEHGGIGTPATRASMLATLQKRGFYTVEKKKLMPTPLGLGLIAALPSIASTPDMTALWHEQQKMIESGELTVDAFLNELEHFIAAQVNNVDLGTVQSVSADNTDTKAYCPMCGKPLFTSSKVMGCKACPFRLFPKIAGKTLTATQIEALLMKGKTGVIKGFRSKAGKSFDALLRLNGEGKVEFSFK